MIDVGDITCAATVKQLKAELESDLEVVSKVAIEAVPSVFTSESLDAASFQWAYSVWAALASTCACSTNPTDGTSCILPALLLARYDLPVCVNAFEIEYADCLLDSSAD